VSVVEAAQRLTGRGIVFEPPKTAAGRRGVALDGDTVILLRRHRARQAEHILSLGGAYRDQDLVFANDIGDPTDPDSVSHAFARIAKGAEAPTVQLHHLRHAHASTLIRAGVHPRVVQDRLGHASAAFTMQVFRLDLESVSRSAQRSGSKRRTRQSAESDLVMDVNSRGQVRITLSEEHK